VGGGGENSVKNDISIPFEEEKLGYENIARAVQEQDGQWRQQPLVDHLEGAAQRAGEFAAAFGNKDWSELSGW